ncbi:hypothetical protein C2G38_18811 [Gigaspora rosea]|uniref:DUF4203 domain-containing protein n=1 Tax=Gigaspora rosea TaxID=44941 RepID=A0A397USF5_9GLOM|nr:hypothetical protein C2G38_18811 [Gigaspora rosea]
MAKNFLFKLVFFFICLFPNVSAVLQLSDMFNFEIKEYIPYIVVTVFLLILIISLHKYDIRWLNEVILYILLIFLSLIFPPIFFYTTEGFSKTTIALISVCIVGIILLIVGSILLAVGTSESLSNFSIIIICMGSMTILGVFVYLIVIFFMFGFDVKIHVSFIVIILLLISLIALTIYYRSNLMKKKTFLILVTILGGLGYYTLFYGILKEVNTISLLLFWSDLWLILLSIYTIIVIINDSIIPKPYEHKHCCMIDLDV